MEDKYKGYRTPKIIIGYIVKKYYRYKLSLRDVSEMLLERGLEVSYETIRKWCKTCGPVVCVEKNPHIIDGALRATDLESDGY